MEVFFLSVRRKVLLSLDEEVFYRLKQYAYDHHMSMSQAVTQWILKQKVSFERLPGQMEVK